MAGLDEHGIVERHEGLQGRVGAITADDTGLAVRGVEGGEAWVRRTASRVGVEAATIAILASARSPVAGATKGDTEAHVRTDRSDGRTIHLGAEESADGEGLVAQHFPGGTEARTTGDETVIGILLVALAVGGGSLAIGTGIQEEREHLLRVPATLDELGGEPVEQFGMEGEVALATELFA